MNSHFGKLFTLANLLCLCLCLFLTTSKSQAHTTPIEKANLTSKAAFDSNISSQEIHRYKIKLKKDQSVHFRIRQMNTDVVIKTYDSEGKKIAEFDSPNGMNGDEFASLLATQTGTYQIDVQSQDEKSHTGRYVLTMQKIHPAAHTAAQKTALLLSRYDYPDLPGLALSVVKDGAIIYKKGVGIANAEYGIPISTSSAFQVGSISKQFTIFSILLLEKEGKLSLDDEVKKYLPELSELGQEFEQPITLRNLANHTHGMRNIDDLLAINGLSDSDAVSNPQALKLIIKQRFLNFAPGTRYQYGNSGYILLADIVERVSGKKFSQFVAEQIFTPLKMHHSRFLDNARAVINHIAYPYTSEPNSLNKILLNSSIVGSTGLVTTVEDMSLWASNFEKMTIGDVRIINKMQKKSVLNNGEVIPYGLGQEMKTYHGMEIIFHGGGTGGYRAYLLRIPSKKISVIVMATSQAVNPLEIAYKTADYFLDLPPLTDTRVATTVNEAQLNAYVGDYEVMPGVIFSIAKDQHDLTFQVYGEQQKTRLKPISQNEFSLSDQYNRVSFDTTKDHSAYLLNFHLYDFNYQGQRVLIKPVDASSVNLMELTGRYFSEELGSTYTLLTRERETGGQQLIASHHRNPDIHLTAFSASPGFERDSFMSNQWFFKKLQFIRDDQSNIKGFLMSGQNATSIYFERTSH
jgi:CubicO group peptidase (beta-lactamase class C family)